MPGVVTLYSECTSAMTISEFLCLQTGDKGEHGEAEGDRGIEAGGKAEAELAPGNGAL